MSEVIHGACLCGQTTFDVHEPQMLCGCHCTRCTRWSGGAGAMVVVVAAKDFKVTKGKDLIKTYREESFADRYFCGNCASHIYVDGGDTYYVGAGVLKDVQLKPAMHVQVAYKAPWDEIGGSSPQYPEWSSS